jgi:hypothetical protein
VASTCCLFRNHKTGTGRSSTPPKTQHTDCKREQCALFLPFSVVIISMKTELIFFPGFYYVTLKKLVSKLTANIKNI